MKTKYILLQKKLLINVIKHLSITLLLLQTFYTLLLANNIIIPINLSQSPPEVKKLVDVFKISKELSTHIFNIAKQEGIDPYFFASLIFTESSFRENVVSSKKYYGLTQIPWAIPYTDINLKIGARIFKEKLLLTKGDIRKTIFLYKGFPLNCNKGKKQVEKVFQVYKQISINESSIN